MLLTDNCCRRSTRKIHFIEFIIITIVKTIFCLKSREKTWKWSKSNINNEHDIVELYFLKLPVLFLINRVVVLIQLIRKRTPMNSSVLNIPKTKKLLIEKKKTNVFHRLSNVLNQNHKEDKYYWSLNADISNVFVVVVVKVRFLSSCLDHSLTIEIESILTDKITYCIEKRMSKSIGKVQNEH